MTLVTGTPLGTITASEDVYPDTAPTIYFQDRDGYYANNPDSDGFYWGLSGTTALPVYELGCYSDFSMVGNVTMNAIRCDTEGDKGVVQKLDYIDVTFNLKALFPLSKLRHIIHGGPVTTTTANTEKMGMGQINNNKYYRCYFPTVYDEDAGDYLSVTGHRCQFVDSWTLTIPYGNQPGLTGIKLRLFADTTMPAAQRFATAVRADESAL